MPFSRQAEAAVRGEGKRARIAGNLTHHKGQITTPQPLLQREQRVLGRSSGDMDQPVTQRLG